MSRLMAVICATSFYNFSGYIYEPFVGYWNTDTKELGTWLRASINLKIVRKMTTQSQAPITLCQ